MGDITEKFETDVLQRLTKALNRHIQRSTGGRAMMGDIPDPHEFYEPGKLTKDTRLEELCPDILERYEFLSEVEEEFKIKIPDKKIDKLKTIGDYVNYLYKEEIFGRR